MRTTLVVGVVLVLSLLGGAASCVAYLAVAPAPSAASSSQFASIVLPFVSLFSLSHFSSGSVPVSISSPVNATSSSISVVLSASTGTVSVSFSNESGGKYSISGTMAKNSAPPSVSLVGSALSISLPVGDLSVTLPSSLHYTIKVTMSTGTLNLDVTGAPASEVNATLGTGSINFNINAGVTRQAVLDVSVGILSGTINSDGSGVQVTASTSTGAVTVHGSNLVTINQSQGFHEVTTTNFDSASQKCIVSLSTNVGLVSAEVD